MPRAECKPAGGSTCLGAFQDALLSFSVLSSPGQIRSHSDTRCHRGLTPLARLIMILPADRPCAARATKLILQPALSRIKIAPVVPTRSREESLCRRTASLTGFAGGAQSIQGTSAESPHRAPGCLVKPVGKEFSHGERDDDEPGNDGARRNG